MARERVSNVDWSSSGIDVVKQLEKGLIIFIIFENMRAKSAMVRKAGTVENELEHQAQKNKMLEEDRRLFLLQA